MILKREPVRPVGFQLVTCGSVVEILSNCAILLDLEILKEKMYKILIHFIDYFERFIVHVCDNILKGVPYLLNIVL